MPLVMLRRGHPTPHFRRTLRDQSGAPLRVLLFTAGEPLEVTADELTQLTQNGDLGAALELCRVDEGGAVRPVKDGPAIKPPATAELQADVAELTGRRDQLTAEIAELGEQRAAAPPPASEKTKRGK